MGRKVSISITGLRIAAYIYLAIPVVIFWLGWLRLPVAIAAVFVLGIGVWSLVRGLMKDRNDVYTMSLMAVCISVIVIILWVMFSGFGGLVWQRPDWHARNAIMHDLLDNRWPVILDGDRGYVYYIGFWMVPALIGKAVGAAMGGECAWNAANATLYAWAVIGILIALFLLYGYAGKSLSGKRAAVVCAFMIMWSGLNLVGQAIVALAGIGTMSLYSIYGWSIYQYTPNMALLEWVFNQAVPAWIGAMLYLHARQREALGEYVAIVLLVLTASPFAAVGVMMLMIPDIIRYRGKGLVSEINICTLISIFPIYALYYGCNMAVSGESERAGFGLFVPLSEFGVYDLMVIVVFCVTQFGVYAFLIRNRYKGDLLFVTDVVVLSVIPFLRIGGERDFIMRGSIIPMWVLMVYVMMAVLDSGLRRSEPRSHEPDESRRRGGMLHGFRFGYLALCVCLLIAAYSSIGDLILICKNTMDPAIENVADDVGSMGRTDLEWWNEYMSGTSYLVDDAGEHAFYRYLAKR